MKIKIQFKTPLVFLLLLPASAFAGRPLNIDDAEPVEEKKFQIEAAVGYRENDESDHFDFPLALTYGVAPRLEIGAGLGGIFEERAETEVGKRRETGLGDLTFAAKWKFFDESGLLPAQSLVPTVKLPTADKEKGLGSGKTDFDLTWIASKTVGEKTGVHVNLGYSWIGGFDDFLHYGLALDYRLCPKIQWVGEIFLQNTLDGGEETVVQFNSGFRWDAAEGFTWDLASGSKLHGDAPDFTITAGFTWLFGFDDKKNKKP